MICCYEVICENPYKTRKGSKQRSEIWERITDFAQKLIGFIFTMILLLFK